MRIRLIIVMVAMLGFLTVSASVAQRPPTEPSSRSLDPDTVARAADPRDR